MYQSSRVKGSRLFPLRGLLSKTGIDLAFPFGMHERPCINSRQTRYVTLPKTVHVVPLVLLDSLPNDPELDRGEKILGYAQQDQSLTHKISPHESTLTRY
jgi:hypothetical protein